MDDRHWSQHTAALAAMLQRRPCGIITDIDGTISSIAPTPDAARVDEACRAALERLTRHCFVAAVSGRAAEDARDMVGIAQMTYIGNHGLDELTPRGLNVSAAAQPYLPRIRDVLAHARKHVNLPGVLVEDKGSTASIHYRQCPDQDAARQTILDAIAPLARQHELRITEGRLVVELRPPMDRDKGAAVRDLIAEHQLQGVMYLGDDVTDVDAFKAVREHGGIAMGIISEETPQVVIQHADLHAHGVADVAKLLDWLADATNQDSAS